MNFRLLSSITLIALLAGVAFASRRTPIGTQSREPANIKVIINQPPGKDGVSPVEIVQPSFVSSVPSKLDDLTYFVRNNSTKVISALAVVRTINYEEGGKGYADSVYCTMDAAFHPDFRGKPLSAGNQISMESAGPIGFDEGVVIKEITLTLEYVLYNDGTSFGAGAEGERIINATREGARRYKTWLAQEYSRAGESLTAIFPLIQVPGIPGALKLELNETVGAERYRLSLLKTLRTKGAADVENYLKQNK